MLWMVGVSDALAVTLQLPFFSDELARHAGTKTNNEMLKMYADFFEEDCDAMDMENKLE